MGVVFTEVREHGRKQGTSITGICRREDSGGSTNSGLSARHGATKEPVKVDSTLKKPGDQLGVEITGRGGVQSENGY